jgi:hypothetical protein
MLWKSELMARENVREVNGQDKARLVEESIQSMCKMAVSGVLL